MTEQPEPATWTALRRVAIYIIDQHNLRKGRSSISGMVAIDDDPNANINDLPSEKFAGWIGEYNETFAEKIPADSISLARLRLTLREKF